MILIGLSNLINLDTDTGADTNADQQLPFGRSRYPASKQGCQGKALAVFSLLGHMKYFENTGE